MMDFRGLIEQIYNFTGILPWLETFYVYNEYKEQDGGNWFLETCNWHELFLLNS